MIPGPSTSPPSPFVRLTILRLRALGVRDVFVLFVALPFFLSFCSVLLFGIVLSHFLRFASLSLSLSQELSKD